MHITHSPQGIAASLATRYVRLVRPQLRYTLVNVQTAEHLGFDQPTMFDLEEPHQRCAAERLDAEVLVQGIGPCVWTRDHRFIEL